MRINLKQFAVFLCLAFLYAAGVQAGIVHFDASHIGLMAIGATTPFPTNPDLTAIAIAYRNPDVALIADQVLPRTPTSYRFKWLSYALAQGFTVPDTRVGRKSQPNQIDFSATEVPDQVADYGLDDYVPNEDILADNQGIDPLGTAAGFLTNLIMLSREVRVAGLVFNAASYNAGLQQTLSGNSQWSDVTSDPVAAIADALDQPLMRPNIAVFGQQTWTKLRRNPKIVQAIKNTNQGSGQVSRQEFADFFELQSIEVGQGQVNLAKRGQPVNMQRVWGKHAAFIYRDRASGPQAGVTFGFTAQFGEKVSGNMPEPKVGLKGSELVRVGEQVKEIICAPDVAYYFQNAVA